jgi:flagellar hook-length control protein FliK
MDASVNSKTSVSLWTTSFYSQSTAGDFLNHFDFGSLLADQGNLQNSNQRSPNRTDPSNDLSDGYVQRKSEFSGTNSSSETGDDRSSLDSRDSKTEESNSADNSDQPQAQEDTGDSESQEENSELAGAISAADQLIQSAVSQEVVQADAPEETSAIAATRATSVELGTSEVQPKQDVSGAETAKVTSDENNSAGLTDNQKTIQQSGQSESTQLNETPETAGAQLELPLDGVEQAAIADPAAKYDLNQNPSPGDSNRRSRAGRRVDRMSGSASGNDPGKSWESKAELSNKPQTNTDLPVSTSADNPQLQTADQQWVQAEITPAASEAIHSAVTDTFVPNINNLSSDLALDSAVYEATSGDRSISTGEIKADNKQSLWQSRQESGSQPYAATAQETSASDVAKNMNQTEKLRLIQRVARSFSRIGPTGGTVQLRLHPPELGALAIQVQVEGRSMAAHLTAQSSAAREVIMESLPQLRQRLAEQGFEISQFTVDVTSDPTMSASTADSQGDRSQQDAPSPGPIATDLRRSIHLRKQLDLMATSANLTTTGFSQRAQPGVDLQA